MTREEAVEIGKAIVAAMQDEQHLAKSKGDTSEYYGIRACAISAIRNIWYDVLPASVRKHYKNNRDLYLEDIWPTE